MQFKNARGVLKAKTYLGFVRNVLLLIAQLVTQILAGRVPGREREKF